MSEIEQATAAPGEKRQTCSHCGHAARYHISRVGGCTVKADGQCPCSLGSQAVRGTEQATAGPGEKRALIRKRPVTRTIWWHVHGVDRHGVSVSSYFGTEDEADRFLAEVSAR